MARRSHSIPNQANPNRSKPKLNRRPGTQAARRFFALALFYLVTGMQIAEASPLLAGLLLDQPGGVRQCSRKISGGKEDRMARSWHRIWTCRSIAATPCRIDRRICCAALQGIVERDDPRIDVDEDVRQVGLECLIRRIV